MSESTISDANGCVCFSVKLKKEVKRIVNDLKRSKGWVKRLCHWIAVKMCRGPIPEIFHNWLIVYACALRTVKYLEEKSQPDKKELEIMATILAYQEMARYERDFATAWSYVNMAMSLIPLVVNDSEVEHCKFLMNVSDTKEQIPGKKKQKAILGSIDLNLKLTLNPKDHQEIRECREQIFKMLDFWLNTTLSLVEETPGNDHIEKYRLYEERLNDTQKWNSKNRQISLKLSLWRSLGYIILFTLLAVIILAEVLHEILNNPNPVFFYPYLYISILGFFGGGLSAFIKVREMAVSIPNYKLIRAHTFLRMIIGGAGALVVFIAARFLEIDEALKLDLLNNPVTFLGLGIASGFSERLFINALEKISENLKIGPEEENDKSETKKVKKEEEQK